MQWHFLPQNKAAISPGRCLCRRRHGNVKGENSHGKTQSRDHRLGTVNPLGNNTADSWAAAKAGKCGIGPITQFDTTDFKCKLAGEVKGFDPETIVDKKEARKMARFTVLALAAAAEAVADSGLDTEAEAKQIGVILSSGIGGLPTIEEQHTRGEEKGMEKVSPYFVPMSIANMAAAQVAIRFGLKGMCTCPVTACAGGTNAVGDASTASVTATRPHGLRRCRELHQPLASAALPA